MAFKTNNPREKMNNTKRALTSASLLQFPASESAYYSKFRFVTYSRSNPKVQAVETGTSVEITLPLPFNLKEQYAINYSGSDLGWTEGAIRTYGDILANPGTITGMNAASRAKAEELLQAFTRSALGNPNLGPISDIGTQVNRSLGTIVNPHLVNVFQSVALRTHNFSWQVSPTSEQEARALQNITFQLREKMHPTKRSEYILGFPDECYVTFHGSDFLYPVFKSVVTNVEFDYTDGRPNAWFTDGAPVTFTLNITLQEVETLTREDFTGDPAGLGINGLSSLPGGVR